MANPVRVVIFKDAGYFVAQCLEHDIGAQASSLDVLRGRFAATFEAERTESLARTGEEFGGIGPAPQMYFDLWEKSAREAQAPMKVPADGGEVDVEMAYCDAA
jgi:hypothetical protein